MFIPVPQSNTNGVLTIVLQEEEFGVGLKFTPTVLGNGRISLKVSPEVSELSPTGVAVSATGVSSTTILPLITTRRASTTVQMNDGESFAIGGLISSNITGNLKAFPGLGEVPVIGALLRSTSFQQDRTELVFVVTPHLVKPLPNSNYPLPTDSFTQPNEADVYATGNMEGRGAARLKDQRAPAGNAPASSSTLPPAQSDSRATTTLPAPAPSAHPAVDESAVPSRDPATTNEIPVSTVSSRELPPEPKDTTASHPNAPRSSSADDQSARAARIEAAAARIAAGSVEHAITVSSASNGPAKQ